MAPSGAGKTTLIRLIAGLEQPDAGTLTVRKADGSTVRLAMVFQEDRLCEELDATDNIRLANRVLSDEDIAAAAEEIGLTGVRGKRTRDFSGGMKRRTALLRALLAEGDLLLLDEPFGGLDKDTRRLAAGFVKARAAGQTILLVTHDREEADLLGAQRIVTFAKSS